MRISANWALFLMIGAIVYTPFCLIEIRMSPHMHVWIYGFEPTGWQEVTYGGYRPKVMLGTGLELALLMAMSATAGLWLWRSGSVKQLWGGAFGGWVVAIIVMAIFCRVTGAWLLGFLGISLWFALKWSNSRMPVYLLMLIVPLYMATRSTGIWSGQHAIDLVQSVINERRAESLGVRITNENMLVAKALQRPVFGWGGWSRSRVLNEDGKDITITDGMWVIALGNCGMVGMLSFFSSLLLPLVILVRRYPVQAWLLPSLAPTAVLAVIVNLYAIDCLANAMFNPMYCLGLGGVMTVLGRSNRGVRHGLEEQAALVDGDDATCFGQSPSGRAARSRRTRSQGRNSDPTRRSGPRPDGTGDGAGGRGGLAIGHPALGDAGRRSSRRARIPQVLARRPQRLGLVPGLATQPRRRGRVACDPAGGTGRGVGPEGGRLLEYPGDRLLPRP